MQTASLNQFQPHPAQMRTSYDLDALASLTLQIYERGLNEWQPILASPRPAANGSGGSDGYYIISGHRRHMAQLVALALRTWAAERPDTVVGIEAARGLINSLVETCGSLADAIPFLLEQHGSEEVGFVPFEGSDKAQILALQNANYGQEQADMVCHRHKGHRPQLPSGGRGRGHRGRNCPQRRAACGLRHQPSGPDRDTA